MGVNGLGSTTILISGMPNAAARACAAVVKVLLTTETDGMPASSVTTVSWRPHAVQDPQSAMACTITSQRSINSSRVAASQASL